MPNEDGSLTAGERLHRIEGMLEKTLGQISTERHRVNNLMHESGLLSDVLDGIKDMSARLLKIEMMGLDSMVEKVKNLEAREIEEEAVNQYRDQLLRGNKLVGVGIVTQLFLTVLLIADKVDWL